MRHPKETQNAKAYLFRKVMTLHLRLSERVSIAAIFLIGLLYVCKESRSKPEAKCNSDRSEPVLPGLTSASIPSSPLRTKSWMRAVSQLLGTNPDIKGLTICSGCHRNMCLDPHRGTDRNPCGMRSNHPPCAARPGPERDVRQSPQFCDEHREQKELAIEHV
jgi:hypothetical protein